MFVAKIKQMNKINVNIECLTIQYLRNAIAILHSIIQRPSDSSPYILNIY